MQFGIELNRSGGIVHNLDTSETSSIQNLSISLKPLARPYLKLWQTITESYPCQKLSDFISVIPRINAKTLLSYVNKSIHKIKIESCEVYLRRGSTNCRPKKVQSRSNLSIDSINFNVGDFQLLLKLRSWASSLWRSFILTHFCLANLFFQKFEPKSAKTIA